MKKEILFVLLKDFADWEGAYIATNLNLGVEPGSESKYIVDVYKRQQSIILERFLILSSLVGNSIASNNAC